MQTSDIDTLKETLLLLAKFLLAKILHTLSISKNFRA